MLVKTIFLLANIMISVFQSARGHLITLNEETWGDILNGEWMVEL